MNDHGFRTPESRRNNRTGLQVGRQEKRTTSVAAPSIG
jgi:hypothetical protein